MSRRIGAAAAALVSALAVSATAQAAKPAPIVVDDNRAECPTAQFTSIEAAVLTAPAGATVRVCPGTYTETVTLTRPVTLLGARNGDASAPGRNDPAQESTIVNLGQGGIEVLPTANDVTIDGFTIQGSGITSATYPGAGIDLFDGSNRTITDTILRGNGIGLHITGSQQGLTVSRNAFVGNLRAQPSGNPAGGIFQDFGSADATSIDHNLFSGNEQFSVNLGSGSNRGLSIDHNVVRDESTFVVIGRTTNAVVSANRGTRVNGNFVDAFGDNVGLTIDHNDATGVPGAGSAIFLGGNQFGTSPAPDTGASVTHNALSGFTRGVRMSLTSGAVVDDNRLTANELDGILLEAATGSSISNNRVDDNGHYGIGASAQSSGNTIDADHATGNATFDCFDDSHGAGTSGTANLWTRDHGDTSSPPGLCR